jgi:hypothetical protein
MKRMHIKGFNPQPDENPGTGQDFFEQFTAKKAEQAKKIISGKYAPSGSASGREFRTTLELQYEFREIISFSESAIVDAMNDLGFELDSLDGKPNWVLYPLQERE